jgi:hypothetical protein
MLGRFDAALKGFMHPGALRDLDWDIRKAGRSAERLHHVSSAEDRALLERFLARFAKLAPRLATLRAAVIHNDANDWNVLVDPADQDRISGLIDFGDALHAPLIAEVAIASAYAGLDHADPIGAAAFDGLIQSLQKTLGLTVFLITHDLDTLYAICDRVAVLADKKVIAVGTIDELIALDHPWIEEYFKGPRGRAAVATQEAHERADETAAAHPTEVQSKQSAPDDADATYAEKEARTR